MTTLPLLASLLTGCGERKFEKCPADHMFNDWGVVNDSRAFGVLPDSSYYIINPVRNVSDSLYYNADYTDSYFHSDSTRIVMQYLPHDSIKFYIDRMYAVEVNPKEMTAKVMWESDTVEDCYLKLRKEGNTDQHFSVVTNPLFRKLLSSGQTLKIRIANSPDAIPNANSQNYDYVLYTAGFKDAFILCDSLNSLKKK